MTICVYFWKVKEMDKKEIKLLSRSVTFMRELNTTLVLVISIGVVLLGILSLLYILKLGN